MSAGSFRNSAICSQINKLGLGNKKITIDLLTTFPNRYKSYTKKVKRFEKNQNINLTRFKTYNHKSGFIDQSIAFIIYAFSVLFFIRGKKYDLVFASSSRIMTAFLGAYISKKKKIKLILDIRDIFLDTMENIFFGFKKTFFSFIINKLENFTIAQASSINLVSEGFKEYFSKKYPQKEYLFYTNGIDHIFTKNKFEHKIKDKNFLLYAGNIGIGQGLERIIPKLAIQFNENWEIIIIGDGSTKTLLTKKINEFNIKNVIIKDPMPQKSLLKYYNKADVLFIHLNKFKAFEKVLPSKIFEYAATGKPILAGVSGFSRNFINHEIENSETFNPCDENSAINSLNKLKLNQTNRSEFIKKYNMKTISKNFANKIISSI